MPHVTAPASSGFQPLRRFRAALVLAAIYTLGVAALLVPLAAIDDWRLYINDDLLTTVRPFGVLLGGAFVILAIARRVGFVAFWVLLSGLWALLLNSGGHALPFEFLKWSVFALPLYLISLIAAGRTIPIRIGSRTISPLIVVGGIWVVLAIAGLVLRDYAFPPEYVRITDGQVTAFERVSALGWVLWAPAPFVIAAVAIAAMWVGSRGGRLE
jgi:hypothetical protein